LHGRKSLDGKILVIGKGCRKQIAPAFAAALSSSKILAKVRHTNCFEMEHIGRMVSFSI